MTRNHSRFRTLAAWGIATTGLLLVAPDSSRAQVVRQVTDLKTGYGGIGVLDDAGTVVFTNSGTNQFGGNTTYSIQVVKFDPVTASGSNLTSFSRGVSEGLQAISVSDDGQWVAFISTGNLTGSNHDESSELFVIKQDGTSLAQLSNDPAPNAGQVKVLAMAGTQTSPTGKVAFVANTNPLGSNADGSDEVFLVNRDGTGLAQVTNLASGTIDSLAISDDGQKIAFVSHGNPTGGNADGNGEVFTVSANGSGLTQISSATAGTASHVTIAGGGSKIAFESTENLTGGNADGTSEIFAANWGSTTILQITNSTTGSTWPSITDDGVFVFFVSDQTKLPTTNLDGNFELWRVRTDGAGLNALTNTIPPTYVGFAEPVTVSGSANRVAFTLWSGNPFHPDLYVISGTGGTMKQLTNTPGSGNGGPAISPDGSRIVFTSNSNPFGTNSDLEQEVFRVQADGTGLAQVTNFPAFGGTAHGVVFDPRIAGDNSTIVFLSSNNPFGTNPDPFYEVFKIQANGTGLAQLTNGDNSSYVARISHNASVVVFQSYSNFSGLNADHSPDIWKVSSSGTGLVQLVSTPAGKYSSGPRVDSSGTWVVFYSNANLTGANADGSYEVFRIRSDGTGLQQMTSDPVYKSYTPDISADGNRIVYASQANPLGTNADHNLEIFSYDISSTTTRQLTNTQPEGYCSGPVISENGAVVHFFSTAEITDENENYQDDQYRVTVATGAIERVGARHGTTLVQSTFYYSLMSTDSTGDHVVFDGQGDFVDQNADHYGEVWMIDRTQKPNITVSKTSPTIVSWPYESGGLRYDVIRGNLGSLGPGGAGIITLGPVVCLENDSPDNNTTGFGDSATPSPGQGFFFVYRASQGTLAGPGSYGKGTSGDEEQPSSGGCTP